MVHPFCPVDRQLDLLSSSKLALVLSLPELNEMNRSESLPEDVENLVGVSLSSSNESDRPRVRRLSSSFWEETRVEELDLDDLSCEVGRGDSRGLPGVLLAFRRRRGGGRDRERRGYDRGDQRLEERVPYI